MKKNKILGLFVALAFASSSVTAFAAVPSWATGIRWEPNSVAMNFESLSDRSDNAYKQGQYAASDWSKNVNFTFKKSTTNGNTLSFGSVNGLTGNWGAWAAPPSNQTSTLKPDYRKITGSYYIIFNSKLAWSFNNTPSSSSYTHFRSVVRHELGHVMGLADIRSGSLNDSIMYYNINGGVVNSIRNSDISNVNTIYDDYNTRSLRGAVTVDESLTTDAQAKQVEVELDAKERVIKDIYNISNNEATNVNHISYYQASPVEFASVAESVVVGNVTKIETGYVANDLGFDIYYSKVYVDVEQTLKGSAPTQIAIAMLGGYDGYTVQIYEGAPLYEVGKSYALYLDGTTRNSKNDKNYSMGGDLNSRV